MKYSEETIVALENAIGKGLSSTVACNLVGITPKTFYLWKTEHPEFWPRMLAARAKKMEYLSEELIKKGFGKETIECPECGEKFEHKYNNAAWQAIAWLLERTEFKEYGNKSRVEHTGKDGGAIEVSVETARKKVFHGLFNKVTDSEKGANTEEH